MIKFLKVIGVLSLILLIGYAASIYYFLDMIRDYWTTDPASVTERFVKNLEQHEEAIIDARNYLISITPKALEITIGFYGEPPNQVSISFQEDSDIRYSQMTDTLKLAPILQRLNWTISTLDTLSKKLALANCNSIQSGNPINLRWQSTQRGIYYYKIFETHLDENQIYMHNDHCRYVYYRDNIVLGYERGHSGPTCIPLK